MVFENKISKMLEVCSKNTYVVLPPRISRLKLQMDQLIDVYQRSCMWIHVASWSKELYVFTRLSASFPPKYNTTNPSVSTKNINVHCTVNVPFLQSTYSISQFCVVEELKAKLD